MPTYPRGEVLVQRVGATIRLGNRAALSLLATSDTAAQLKLSLYKASTFRAVPGPLACANGIPVWIEQGSRLEIDSDIVIYLGGVAAGECLGLRYYGPEDCAPATRKDS